MKNSNKKSIIIYGLISIIAPIALTLGVSIFMGLNYTKLEWQLLRHIFSPLNIGIDLLITFLYASLLFGVVLTVVMHDANKKIFISVITGIIFILIFTFITVRGYIRATQIQQFCLFTLCFITLSTYIILLIFLIVKKKHKKM